MTIEATVTTRDGAGAQRSSKIRSPARCCATRGDASTEQRFTMPSVTIAGMTVPNTIRVHGDTTVADGNGAFKHVISIERNGDHRVPLLRALVCIREPLKS